MAPTFHDQPILNSPYECPTRHWELDEDRLPTNRILEQRRSFDFVTPVPKPLGQRGGQSELALQQAAAALGDAKQRYELGPVINSLRQRLAEWRQLPRAQWRVTPQTAQLLQHWRQHQFSGIRPFFCQVEAAETVIWLTEVAPRLAAGRAVLTHLEDVNEAANPGLSRLALKLATGAGKTTVMAMLIAWQTVNAVRQPRSRFTRSFLVVTPGITIRDRLQVLKPDEPGSYYQERELVPREMLGDLQRAEIVITNYHAFIRRERMSLAKGSRGLLEGAGPNSPALETRETEGQMLRRVMPKLMNAKNIWVFNDEGHHCYRERPEQASEEGDLGEQHEEAERNQEAARVWISGLETVDRKLGLGRVIDLSATPFFLSGSGYAEGTLFPWTMCDFSLMDAIECGIVKLPRVPVADNIPGAEVPIYRELWKHIGKEMPKKGRRASTRSLDPLQLPTKLQSALDALYGHYERVFKEWEAANIDVPPCFIVVCNNTATSKLLYDHIAGFQPPAKDGIEGPPVPGRLPLFSNYEAGEALPRPRTLLIDSEQLESGQALDKKFQEVAKEEIERFRRQSMNEQGAAADFTDADLLREAVNTVGKAGRLGGGIRCVVSVAMLTEGWDANTVTHVLGVRAFGTQLLCEQVVGRALRRQSYALNEQGLFDVEYADVLGIPFDFTAKPAIVKPGRPVNTVLVQAVSPDRDDCEIRFPCVAGYRVELPEDRLKAVFDEDSTLELTPERVGPAETTNKGIVGESVELNLAHTATTRLTTVAYHLARHLVETKWQDKDGAPRLHLFGQLKCIAERWLREHLVCKGGTYPAQLLYRQLGDEACERITRCIQPERGGPVATVVLDPYNATGSTADVRFATSKETYRTDSRRCHVNHVVCDSGWEAEFARSIEAHPDIRAYVKNQGLGLTVPYLLGGEARSYLPDFIVLADDGHGDDDLLHLVVEVKGRRQEDAKAKADTMRKQWLPGVNRLGEHGRWAFVELRDVYSMREDVDAALAATGDRRAVP